MAIPCHLHTRYALWRSVTSVTAAIIGIRLHCVNSTVQPTTIPGANLFELGRGLMAEGDIWHCCSG